MKKIILAGIAAVLLCGGCEAEPAKDAVISQMSKMDVPVCNNMVDVEKEIQKQKAETIQEIRWNAIPENQEILKQLKTLFTSIDSGKIPGCKMEYGENDEWEDPLVTLRRWCEETRYGLEDDIGDFVTKKYFEVHFKTKEDQVKLLQKLEQMGFSDLTKQVVDKQMDSQLKDCVIGKKGICFRFYDDEGEHHFYNVMSVEIPVSFVFIPDVLKEVIPNEITEAFMADSILPGGKIKKASFYGMDGSDVLQNSVTYYISNRKLLQAEYEFSLYCDIEADIVSNIDSAKLQLTRAEKDALVKTLMQFGITKEQGESVAEKVQEKKVFNGQSGSIHWYMEKVKSPQAEEKWRLRIQNN